MGGEGGGGGGRTKGYEGGKDTQREGRGREGKTEEGKEVGKWNVSKGWREDRRNRNGKG